MEHVLILVATMVLAIILQRTLSLSDLFTLEVLAIAGCGGALSLSLASKHLAGGSYGAANRVTLLRGGLVAVLFALTTEVDAGWAAFVIAAVALALDGVDGWLARRLRLASGFGARFDMEVDALALLALTVLVWQHGKAGAWILVAGLLRYGFVAAARIEPRLARPLPARWRRKAAFVVVAMALIVCLAPVVGSPIAAPLALIALAVLIASFAVDVVYLLRSEKPARV